MIEKLTNCPNCGGYLNDSGRCEFCGSKVFDFLSIDFDGLHRPSAKTYIRIKTGSHIVLAPIVVDTVNLEMQTDEYPRCSVDFIITGNMLAIESVGEQQ